MKARNDGVTPPFGGGRMRNRNGPFIRLLMTRPKIATIGSTNSQSVVGPTAMVRDFCFVTKKLWRPPKVGDGEYRATLIKTGLGQIAAFA